MSKPRSSGFTIVELLIVIVVIGILAAITIVAYNGIQARAQVATLTTDLSGAARQLAVHEVDAGIYPATLAVANNGQGVKASEGTTYQYTGGGSTYCLTATRGTTSYKVSNTATTPIAGGCAGHGIGGMTPITNLASNPSLEQNMTNWGSTWVATPVARVTGGVGIVTGIAALEINLGTANASGAQYTHTNLQAGTTYSASAYVTLVSGDGTPLQVSASDGAGTRASKTIASSLIIGQPVRVNLTWTSSATPNGSVAIMRNGTSVGAGVIRVDNFMITQGSTIYNYADGASSNWVWNGAVNNSTSTGPQL